MHSITIDYQNFCYLLLIYFWISGGWVSVRSGAKKRDSFAFIVVWHLQCVLVHLMLKLKWKWCLNKDEICIPKMRWKKYSPSKYNWIKLNWDTEGANLSTMRITIKNDIVNAQLMTMKCILANVEIWKWIVSALSYAELFQFLVCLKWWNEIKQWKFVLSPLRI